jgi:hypothetical protein
MSTDAQGDSRERPAPIQIYGNQGRPRGLFLLRDINDTQFLLVKKEQQTQQDSQEMGGAIWPKGCISQLQYSKA